MARWVRRPRCCCARLCIWMPIHSPDEIACCVSVIISGNDDILKSCNTYTINFTILWKEALSFLGLRCFPQPPRPSAPTPECLSWEGSNPPLSCCVPLSNSISLSVLAQAAFRKPSDSRAVLGGHWAKRVGKTLPTCPLT